MVQRTTVIDPSSVSQEEILNNINDFIKGQPDEARWKDFFAGGVGTTISELAAGLGAFLRYNALGNLRETTLLTARLKRQIYGLADTFGYPINRSVAAEVSIVVNNTSGSPIYWNREDIVGYLFGRPLSFKSTITIPNGKSTLLCVGGQWAQQTIISDTSVDYATIAFETLDVDISQIDNNLFELYLNNVQQEYTRYVEQIDKQWDNGNGQGVPILKSLIDRFRFVFGSNLLGYKLAAGTNVTVRYLVVASESLTVDQTYTPTSVQMINKSLDVVSVTLLQPTLPPDTLNKIVELVPGYFSTRRRMVTDFDHEYVVESYPGIIDAKFKPGQCMEQTILATPKVVSFDVLTGNSSGDLEFFDLQGIETIVPAKAVDYILLFSVDPTTAVVTFILHGTTVTFPIGTTTTTAKTLIEATGYNTEIISSVTADAETPVAGQLTVHVTYTQSVGNVTPSLTVSPITQVTILSGPVINAPFTGALTTANLIAAADYSSSLAINYVTATGTPVAKALDYVITFDSNPTLSTYNLVIHGTTVVLPIGTTPASSEAIIEGATYDAAIIDTLTVDVAAPDITIHILFTEEAGDIVPDVYAYPPSVNWLGTYDAATTYAINNVVIYNDAIYNSLVGSNLNLQPDINPASWDNITEIHLDTTTLITAFTGLTITVYYTPWAGNVTPSFLITPPGATLTISSVTTDVPWDAGGPYDNDQVAPYITTEAFCDQLEIDLDNLTTWESGITGCCTATMSYLFQDEHYLMSAEKEYLLEYLDGFRMPGEGILFQDPQVVYIDPTIQVVIEEGTDTAQLESYIVAYLNSIVFRLNGIFHPADVATYCNSLLGVIRTYLIRPTQDYQLVYYKYFKIRTVNIFFTTSQQLLTGYGTELSSGTGYSEDWKGVYSNTFAYSMNDVVQYGALLYKSLVDNNRGFTPNISPAYWLAL